MLLATLGKWMSASEIDSDFTACDTALLNRFFAEYLGTHTQGGTNTLERNLAHLFAFLDEVYDHPSGLAAENRCRSGSRALRGRASPSTWVQDPESARRPSSIRRQQPVRRWRRPSPLGAARQSSAALTGPGNGPGGQASR